MFELKNITTKKIHLGEKGRRRIYVDDLLAVVKKHYPANSHAFWIAERVSVYVAREAAVQKSELRGLQRIVERMR